MRTILLLMLIAAVPVDAGDAADRAKELAPFINEHSLIIIHADAEKMDLDGAEAWVKDSIKSAKLKPEDEARQLRDLEALAKQARDWQKQFTQAGGKRLYLVQSFDDKQPWPTLLIAPLAEKSDAKMIGQLLLGEKQKDDPRAAETISNCMCMGQANHIGLFQKFKAADRADMIKALELTDGKNVQIMLLPTDAVRKKLAAQFQIPQPWTMAVEKAWSWQISWMVAGIEVGKAPGGNLTIQSPNRFTSVGLYATMRGLLELAKSTGDIKKAFPDITEIANGMTPKLNRDQVIIPLESAVIQRIMLDVLNWQTAP